MAQPKKVHPLNDPAQWNESQEPPYFDVKRFQNRIDRITGKNRDGHSILALKWAPQLWTRYFGVSMPEYWYARFKRGGEWRYKLVPRWVLVERVEPGTYVDSWNATRYALRDESGVVVDKGEPPREMWKFKSACAVHSELRNEKGVPACCQAIESESNNYRRCWGEYREPNDADIKAIQEAWEAVLAEPFFNRYDPVSPEQLEYIAANARYELLAADRAYDDRWWEVYQDQVDLWGYRVTNDDPSVAHHGRRHFPFLHKTESGIWTPNEVKKEETTNVH